MGRGIIPFLQTAKEKQYFFFLLVCRNLIFFSNNKTCPEYKQYHQKISSLLQELLGSHFPIDKPVTSQPVLKTST